MATAMTVERRMAVKKTRNLDLRMVNPPWRWKSPDDDDPLPPEDPEEGGAVAERVEVHPVVFFAVRERPSSEMENKYDASSRVASPWVAVGDESWKLVYQYPVWPGAREGHVPSYDPDIEM